MKKAFNIFLSFGLLTLTTNQAHADSETAKNVISGIIDFGLQQIEQEMQGEKTEPTAYKNNNATHMGLQ